MLGTQGRPVDCRIENIRSSDCGPFEPGMSFLAHPCSFADNEANIVRAAHMHQIVKRDSFAFAIGRSSGFHLSRRLPLFDKTVGDRAQVLDPMIDQAQRNLLFGAMAGSTQHRLYSRHLPVIGGVVDRRER